MQLLLLRGKSIIRQANGILIALFSSQLKRSMIGRYLPVPADRPSFHFVYK